MTEGGLPDPTYSTTRWSRRASTTHLVYPEKVSNLTTTTPTVDTDSGNAGPVTTYRIIIHPPSICPSLSPSFHLPSALRAPGYRRNRASTTAPVPVHSLPKRREKRTRCIDDGVSLHRRSLSRPLILCGSCLRCCAVIPSSIPSQAVPSPHPVLCVLHDHARSPVRRRELVHPQTVQQTHRIAMLGARTATHRNAPPCKPALGRTQMIPGRARPGSPAARRERNSADHVWRGRGGRGKGGDGHPARNRGTSGSWRGSGSLRGS